MGVNASLDTKKIANENNIPLTESNLPPITTHESDKFYFDPMTSQNYVKLFSLFHRTTHQDGNKIPVSVIKDALPTILPITKLVNSSPLTSVFLKIRRNLK